MCRLSSSEYDHVWRSSAKPERSLLEWLRSLWRPRQPEVKEAEVLPFVAASASPSKGVERKGSKAA